MLGAACWGFGFYMFDPQRHDMPSVIVACDPRQLFSYPTSDLQTPGSQSQIMLDLVGPSWKVVTEELYYKHQSTLVAEQVQIPGFPQQMSPIVMDLLLLLDMSYVRYDVPNVQAHLQQ